MKMISWNVNGIRACVGKNFMDFFKEKQATVYISLTTMEASMVRRSIMTVNTISSSLL